MVGVADWAARAVEADAAVAVVVVVGGGGGGGGDGGGGRGGGGVGGGGSGGGGERAVAVALEVSAVGSIREEYGAELHGAGPRSAGLSRHFLAVDGVVVDAHDGLSTCVAGLTVCCALASDAVCAAGATCSSVTCYFQRAFLPACLPACLHATRSAPPPAARSPRCPRTYTSIRASPPPRQTL